MMSPIFSDRRNAFKVQNKLESNHLNIQIQLRILFKVNTLNRLHTLVHKIFF